MMSDYPNRIKISEEAKGFYKYFRDEFLSKGKTRILNIDIFMHCLFLGHLNKKSKKLVKPEENIPINQFLDPGKEINLYIVNFVVCNFEGISNDELLKWSMNEIFSKAEEIANAGYDFLKKHVQDNSYDLYKFMENQIKEMVH